ncbi:hypothetical protein [Salinisphaera aquimarina]|uniref:Uncharacterized protein n=1 Tax=Salinisphaera aquimarina TaxID=2094031 RepID=A0ABV7EKQ4_9GAMM
MRRALLTALIAMPLALALGATLPAMADADDLIPPTSAWKPHITFTRVISSRSNI